MGDVVFVALVIALFAIGIAYVRGCARIVGDDEVVRVETGMVDAGDAESGVGATRTAGQHEHG